MSTKKKLLEAAAGAAGGGVTYVDDVFSTFLYKGIYSNTDIVNNIDLAGEGGLVWTKKRNSTRAHDLSDTERGVTKSLYSSNPDAQGTDSQGLLAFNSNGYRIGGSSSYNNTNDDYVSWTFRKQPGFFDIVTWDGNGTSGRAISHNLGSVPGMIIVKSYQHPGGVGNTDWLVYHRGLNGGTNPHNYGTLLNTAGTENAQAWWNNTAPTSTQFEVNASQDINGSGGKYVAYLFAHDEQDFGENSDEAIIKCGSYTGNGSSSGVEVDLGFEPQWLFVKTTSHSGYYSPLVDSMRGFVVGGNDATVWPNVSDAEYSGANYLDPTSSGFIATDTNNTNISGGSYIYMAIRRPHKPASEFAATDLFNVDLGDANDPGFDTGFPVDMGIFRLYESVADFDIMTRLTGPRRLDFTNGAEANKTNAEFDYMDGWVSSGMASHIGWAWRRAPGHCDVVTYTGNQTARQIAHNLGVVPEMMWVKCRSQVRNWAVYHASEGNTKVANLNNTGAFSASTDSWNNTSPTSTHFTVGDGATTNFNPEPMIAYLFASVAGISKVGSYTGTGNDLNVDCGFSAGARFVLVKRTDSTGDWYLYDSVRGIVAGNDPYLLMNSSAAQVTNTDYIDPLSSGFTVTSSAPAGLNASGGTYIFYAIA